MSRQIATSQLTMDNGVPCAAQAQTVRLRTLQQVHASAVTDPRGGDVRVEFRMKDGSGVLWESGLSTAKPSGSSFAASVPAGLPKEASLHWEARSRAGGRYGPWSSAGPQNACHFVWDTTAPAAPVISSAEYPESAPVNPVDPWRDGVGQYGWFTLTAADPDVTAYRYGVNGSPDTLIAVHDGAPVTIPVLPEKSGLHFLTAQALDAAGHASEVRTYQYRVAEGRPERALWPMDDSAGSPQAVAREVSRTAALHGGAALAAAGVEGGALSLDGVDGHAETPRPLVDTHHAFSVSAWAQVSDKPDGPAVVAAQAGNELAGFELSYVGEVDRWTFGHAAEDRAGSDTVRAMADGPGDAQEGEWAHLVGVYDAADEALRLYVDGQLAGETRHRITWNARGPFTVGAHSHAGLVGGYFAGAVDELQVYDRSLTPAEISTLFAGDSLVREPLAALSFEEPETARATAARGQARAALLHGGAATGAPGVVDGSLTLDGVTGFAQAGAAQLNTARSYTVSAWAHLDA
jgi:hypothetical protein